MIVGKVVTALARLDFHRLLSLGLYQGTGLGLYRSLLLNLLLWLIRSTCIILACRSKVVIELQRRNLLTRNQRYATGLFYKEKRMLLMKYEYFSILLIL